MGAYLRCPKCDTGHDKPTAYVDLAEGGRRCGCGARLPSRTVETWIAKLDERLTDIEQAVAKIAAIVVPLKLRRKK